MKRSILLIGNYPPPYGGVPHHIERLTAYLADHGWNCHVLAGGTTGYERKGRIHIYKPTFFRKLVGLIRQLWYRSASDWREDRMVRKTNLRFWLRHLIYADVGAEIMRKQDIKLISAYNLLTYGPVGDHLSRRFRVPLVISLFGEIYKNTSMLSCQRYFVDLLQRTHMLLSCSSHCGRSIQMLGSNAEVETIAYGVAIDHFAPANSGHQSDQRVSADRRTILFVGRLDSEMGLDSFLAVAQRLIKQDPTIRVTMVGQRGNLTDVALAAASAHADGRMAVFPNVRYDTLPNFYREAYCLVVPTRGTRTCSSLAAMEAMATGTPVIAYDIGGIREIVHHESTGLMVPPENVNALELAIARILADNSLYQRLRTASLTYARAHFGEDRTNRTLEARFLSLLRSE